jgi:hypothetical protein
VRRGFGVLGPVIALAFVAGLIVLAVHTLWRGSSRTLFSVQEHRQLLGIARSAIEETVYTLQAELDGGATELERWMRRADQQPGELVYRTFKNDIATANLPLSNGLSYRIEGRVRPLGEVTVRRLRAVGPPTRGTPRELGLIQLEARVMVERRTPKHEEYLLLRDHRTVRLADDLGPWHAAGKHYEISGTTVGREVDAWVPGP